MTRLDVRHILCPVDFSQLSDEALATAAAMARARDAELRLVHVVPATGVTAAEGLSSVDRQRLLARLREMLEETGLDPNRIGAAVRQGDPGTEILRFARATPADVVVMGAAGADRPERPSGPVTSVVVARSECPVLTVPLWLAVGAHAGVFRRIVCAIDLTPPCAGIIDQAVSLASETGGRVTCVHVQRDGDGTMCSDMRSDLMAAIPTDANQLCEVEVIIDKGVPATAITRIVRRAKADLLVIGPPRRWTSTAHAVLSTSLCPVLVAHDIRPLRRFRADSPGAAALTGSPLPWGRTSRR